MTPIRQRRASPARRNKKYTVSGTHTRLVTRSHQLVQFVAKMILSLCLRLGIEVSVKRTTVTLTNELEEALEAYREAQEVDLSTTAITQAALREFLSQRGFLRTRRTFWLTPSEHGSGDPHASRNHNHSVAEAAEIK